MAKKIDPVEIEGEVGSEAWQEELKKIKNTKEWQATLLNLLDKSELIDGYPSTDGLARLFRLAFGEFSSEIGVVKAPTTDDRSATVVVTVWVYNVLYGRIKHSGAADVSTNNTKAPYNAHPVASAETKALGRALKRALALQIHTHEEMMDGEASYEKIQEIQIKAVVNMAKKIDVDLSKFLASECGVTVDSFLQGMCTLSKEDGSKLIEQLNVMGNKGVPEELQIGSVATLNNNYPPQPCGLKG